MKSKRLPVILPILIFLVLVAPPALLADQAEVFGPNPARR